MRCFSKTFLIAALAFPWLAGANQTIQYEPAVVELKGKVVSGKFQHPNGEWVRFSYLRLKEPVDIKNDPDNPINVAETGVTEIQLLPPAKEVSATLKATAKARKEVTIKGTLFHGHTAWHVRPLVMGISKVE